MGVIVTDVGQQVQRVVQVRPRVCVVPVVRGQAVLDGLRRSAPAPALTGPTGRAGVVDLQQHAPLVRASDGRILGDDLSLMLLLLSSGGSDGLLRGEPVAVFMEESGIADVAAFDA